MKIAIALACVLFAANGYATECVRNAQGKEVCANKNGVTTVNKVGNTAVATQTNTNGVKTTKTSNGGTAKAKNGKGVYESPNGTKCVKTANNAGCK